MRGVIDAFRNDDCDASFARLHYLCSHPIACRNISVIAENASGHLVAEFARQLRQLPAVSGDSECGAALLQFVTSLAGSSVREKK